MSDLLPFVITGIAAGSLYGLAGLGLVLTYRTSGVLNLAHGAIAALAAAIFYSLHIEQGLAWPLAGAITVALFTLVGGFGLELFARTLTGAPAAVSIVATVGLLLAVNGGINLVYGTTVRRFPEFLPTSGFELGGVTITWGRAIEVTLATTAAAVLYLFLQRARLGVAVRAVVDDRNLVSLTGTRPTRIGRTSWAIGSAFAAVSGILLAPVLGLDAVLLTFVVVQAFGACAIARFSSLPLTYAGGLVVGVAAAIATRHLTTPPWNGLPPTVPYLFLIVVLLVVSPDTLPQFQRGARNFAAAASITPSRALYVASAVGLGGLLIVPSVVGTNLPVWIAGLAYAIVFMSLALLAWMSGQLSLCHMAFVAVGATTFAKLQGSGLPWGLALLGAGLATVPVGALVAIPAIRLSGIYLALVTLGFGILMQNVVFQTDLMFGSTLFATGSRPSFGPIDTGDTSYYYVVLAVALAVVGALLAIARSSLGLFLRALAESPTMLSTHGLGVNTTRMLVFCTSAFLAAIAGGLLVGQSGTVSGVAFGPLASMILVAVLAMCGTRPLRSAILAAGLFTLLPAYVTSFDQDQQLFAFGLAAMTASVLLAQRDAIGARIDAAATRSAERREAGSFAGARYARELELRGSA